MVKNNPKPTSDIIFRKLFGSDENKDLLVELINAVLMEPSAGGSTDLPAPQQIVDVVIKNPFQLADYDGAKESILDIKAVDQAGRWYDVEIQMLGHAYYGRRAIYYAAKTYVEQLESGAPYGNLNPTIGIHFLGYNMFSDARVVRQFTFADVETNDRPEQLSDLRLYFVELEKFHKDWSALATALDLWMAFLIHGEHLHKSSLPPVMHSSPGVVKAVVELERFGSDPSTRMVYEGWEKARMASVAEIEYAVEQERRAKAAEIQYAEEHGIEIGEERGQSRLLMRQLTRLLGDPPTAVSAGIEQLSSAQLLELGEALFDFHSYADVEAWLKSH